MPKSRTRSTQRKAPDHTIQGDIGGGPGASDSNSGGGNATGTPDAETGMRLSRPPGRGDPKEDRAKLFPERFASGKKRSAAKGRSPKPLKKHGDKFEDKIPTNTRSAAKSRGGAKRK